jgi:hypothetical protein
MAKWSRRLVHKRWGYRKRVSARSVIRSGSLFGLAGMLVAVGWWFPPAWIAVLVLVPLGLFFIFTAAGVVTGLELL